MVPFPKARLSTQQTRLTLTKAARGFMETVFRPEEAQTPEEAADPIAWLATLPPGTAEPYGELVERRSVIPCGD